MGLNINQARQSGFTIVELLIVVVVIAILAAITIVSYNGITTNANDAAQKSFTSTVAKKLEAYQAEQGRYPVTVAELSTDSSKSFYINLADAVGTTSGTYGNAAALYQASITEGSSSLNANVGKNAVIIRKCSAAALTPTNNQAAVDATNVSGLEIYSWSYTSAAVNTTPVKLGVTTNCPAS